MPELHKNQIEWNAPEPQKVSLAKPDYSPVADALGTLGRAAKEFSEYKAQIDDIDAKEKMNQSAAEAVAKLEKLQVSDDNYEEALNNFNTTLKQQFDSFDGPTKTRFMRDNPTYFQEKDLGAREIIFDKQQKFAITKVKNLIPLLSSNVTEGVESYEVARKKLDNMVAKVDNVTAEELINDFDRRVQYGNLVNMVAEGRYSDAITMLENPKESDKLYPEERTSEKIAIQKMVKEDAKARETMRKEAIQDINNAIEKGLVNTLLIQLDKKDNSYGETIRLLDDPNAKIGLMNSDGKIEGYITAKDIPVEVRREALKKARTYEEDSMSYRVNSLRAKELSQNFEAQYKSAKTNRPSGEVFNNVYAFTQSADFYYLNKEDQEKMLDIVYGEVNRYNEQVVPYGNIRDQRLLYGTIDQWSGPSGPAVVRGYVFGKDKIPAAEKNKLSSVANLELSLVAPGLAAVSRAPEATSAFNDPRVGYDQLTANLKQQYEKETNKEVKNGSALEYLMNLYAAALVYKPEERKAVGLDNATDEQIGLTFARLKGVLETNGEGSRIIGQNMTEEQAESIRKNIFDSFYNIVNNGTNSSLTKDQEMMKKKLYDNLRSGSYGRGGKTFEPGEYSVVDNNKVYAKPLTDQFFNQLKKENK